MAAALTPQRGAADAPDRLEITAQDGLSLIVHAWGKENGGHALPLLCLPGLARTGGDFARLGVRFGPNRAVFAVDYAGRGQSGRSRDWHRYAAEACVKDLLDILAALALRQVVAIGTSFGGILAMGLAAARPGLLNGIVLNDVGPEIGAAGQASIRDFMSEPAEFEDLAQAVGHLKRRFPHFEMGGDGGWQELARLTYQPDTSGRWKPVWDPLVARLVAGPVPDLWPLFGRIVHLPVLLLRGGLSDVLLPSTVERMRRMHPAMQVLEVAGVGHAPTLAEPPVLAALDAFLGRFN